MNVEQMKALAMTQGLVAAMADNKRNYAVEGGVITAADVTALGLTTNANRKNGAAYISTTGAIRFRATTVQVDGIEVGKPLFAGMKFDIEISDYTDKNGVARQWTNVYIYVA